MKTQKMSLANIQGKLSRAEMKNIMAGSGTCAARWDKCCTTSDCCTGLSCTKNTDSQNYCGIG